MNVDDRTFLRWKQEIEACIEAVRKNAAVNLCPVGRHVSGPAPIDFLDDIAPMTVAESSLEREREARIAALMNVAHEESKRWERHAAHESRVCDGSHCPFCRYDLRQVMSLEGLYARPAYRHPR